MHFTKIIHWKEITLVPILKDLKVLLSESIRNFLSLQLYRQTGHLVSCWQVKLIMILMNHAYSGYISVTFHSAESFYYEVFKSCAIIRAVVEKAIIMVIHRGIFRKWLNEIKFGLTNYTSSFLKVEILSKASRRQRRIWILSIVRRKRQNTVV